MNRNALNVTAALNHANLSGLKNGEQVKSDRYSGALVSVKPGFSGSYNSGSNPEYITAPGTNEIWWATIKLADGRKVLAPLNTITRA